MTQNNYTELHTKRLSLKRLKKNDWEEVSFLRSDNEVNKYVKRPSAETFEKALAFIEKIDNGVSNNKLFYWKITTNKTDRMIGSICLWNFSENGEIAEVGYDLHPNYQGLGIMSEALDCIINYGFNTLRLKVIEAYTNGKNKSSTILLERKGFNLLDGKKDKDNIDNVIYELRVDAANSSYTPPHNLAPEQNR